MAYGQYLVPTDDLVLKAIAARVEPGENIGETMRIMERICRRNTVRGAGLAAPQIGVSKRIIVLMGHRGPQFLINPEIERRNGITSLYNEGCLSYPDVHKVIARDTWISVSYEDTRRIKRYRVIFQDFNARVVLHEIDHLNGICRVGDDSPPDGVLPVYDPPKVSGVLAMSILATAAALGMNGMRDR